MWYLEFSHVLRTPQEPLRSYVYFFWKSEYVGASRGHIWKGYCDTVQRMNKMDITNAEELVKAFNPVSEQTNPTLAVTASFPVRFLHDILVTHQRWKPSKGPSIRIYGSSMTLAWKRTVCTQPLGLKTSCFYWNYSRWILKAHSYFQYKWLLEGQYK